jgi:hypothetical protein
MWNLHQQGGTALSVPAFCNALARDTIPLGFEGKAMLQNQTAKLPDEQQGLLHNEFVENDQDYRRMRASLLDPY